MTTEITTKFALPALRARMGDWIYYICFMQMKEIVSRVDIVEDIHASKLLRELLQRRLTDRSNKIGDYLLNQTQRFFSALVVATYGGEPEWNEVAIRDSASSLGLIPDHLEGALGILTLQGTEKLFAVDGQHRVKGIGRAISIRPSLGEEEVCVIIVKGVSAELRVEDPEGFERTRRLFTTLNRYAKPVNMGDIIALDEDDVVAIITRRIVEQHWIKDRISLNLTKNMPVRDRTNITSIRALYDVMDVYFKSGRTWKDYKKLRPSDSEIETFYHGAVALLDSLRENFTALEEVSRDESIGDLGAYRDEKGGHLLFRPIGFILIVRAIRHLIDMNFSLGESVARIREIPMDLSTDPWSGLLWDPQNGRMLTEPNNQKVAYGILVDRIGGDISKVRRGYSREKLREELAGILNISVADVEL